MSKKKSKPMPPRGPRTNVRPAGPHEDKRKKILDRLTAEAAEMGEYDPEK